MSTRDSSCTISGFFFLICCTRLEGDAVFETPNGRHATAVSSHFLYYEMMVTCMDGHTTITIIRARSDSNDIDQPITSVAFLTGTFFINSSTQSAYLDTTEIKWIPTPRFSTHLLQLLEWYADCRTNLTMNRLFSLLNFPFTSSMTSNHFG
jgi:hypothetical protein